MHFVFFFMFSLQCLVLSLSFHLHLHKIYDWLQEEINYLLYFIPIRCSDWSQDHHQVHTRLVHLVSYISESKNQMHMHAKKYACQVSHRAYLQEIQESLEQLSWNMAEMMKNMAKQQKAIAKQAQQHGCNRCSNHAHCNCAGQDNVLLLQSAQVTGRKSCTNKNKFTRELALLSPNSHGHGIFFLND